MDGGCVRNLILKSSVIYFHLHFTLHFITVIKTFFLGQVTVIKLLFFKRLRLLNLRIMLTGAPEARVKKIKKKVLN